MDIQFECNKCGQHIVIDDSGAGLRAQCPSCQQELTVPATPAQSQPASAGTAGLNKPDSLVAFSVYCDVCGKEMVLDKERSAVAISCEKCGHMVKLPPKCERYSSEAIRRWVDARRYESRRAELVRQWSEKFDELERQCQDLERDDPFQADAIPDENSVGLSPDAAVALIRKSPTLREKNEVSEIRVAGGTDVGVCVFRSVNGYQVKRSALIQILEWRRAGHRNINYSWADLRTDIAELEIDECRNLLKFGLSVDGELVQNLWRSCYHFPKAKPQHPRYLQLPRIPVKADHSKSLEIRTSQTISDEIKNLSTLFESWRRERDKVVQSNKKERDNYDGALKQWHDEEADFLKLLSERFSYPALTRRYYLESPADYIEVYFVSVLLTSEYPNSFPREHEVVYNPETKIALVEYSLPSLEHIPKLKTVKYVQSRHKYVEKYLSEAERNKLYDDVIYQIALRAIHELYQADVSRIVDSIVFNGWVKSINPATGKETNPCVISVQVSRDEFSKIDLAHVEPKACFKALKGIGSSTLHSLTPIAPILVLNREDKRFVPSYNVAAELSDAYNLAAMEWEDFEHLIRELFEKEFAQYGGEVKVTRASRDHGVDAVVFDPDIIRGGKIVIQAKRYTNTVDVSAVRDLYGTVINEGASKGILVTTADYGADAYEFAKGKPLTLLNGSNLLHLLAKHGHKAKIDLNEAKRIIAERERQESAR